MVINGNKNFRTLGNYLFGNYPGQSQHCKLGVAHAYGVPKTPYRHFKNMTRKRRMLGVRPFWGRMLEVNTLGNALDRQLQVGLLPAYMRTVQPALSNVF
jgi:hypothetical protein